MEKAQPYQDTFGYWPRKTTDHYAICIVSSTRISGALEYGRAQTHILIVPTLHRDNGSIMKAYQHRTWRRSRLVSSNKSPKHPFVDYKRKLWTAEDIDGWHQ
ncbi:hypothetical protein HO173_011136 [Letharia columbiana]|uniref:Uncharacterized protein n=1 Tax=Letharia columbiana TaxID=112416 RepID=A0A8H6FLA5_9LECA|nr:uncharacterized protein HO173_011136 [Letharia columbiana]KAF6230599.1 hypothetical protein HO173_011136 [Letharia columbiana]